MSPPALKRARLSSDDGGDSDYAVEAVPESPCPSLEKLRPRVLALSREQLSDVLLNYVAAGTIAEADLVAHLPSPDLKPVAEALQKANNAIRKSLPNSRYGSCTDDFGYRRCATHVVAFKKLIAEEAKTLEAAGAWMTVLDFCVLAEEEAEKSVVWDNDKKNSWRGTVDKNLKRLALKSTKAMIKDKSVGREQLQKILFDYQDSFPAIEAPLKAAIAKRKHRTSCFQ